MTGARREEILRLAAWLALCIVVGLLFDRPILVTALGLAVYASWHIWQASRLVNWLKDSENVEVPESHGLWGEIFTSLYQLQQQNRADKRQLASMLNEFQASTAALPDAVVVVDDDGCIAWCNEAAVSMLGLRVPKDIGQRIVNLLRNPAFVRAFLNEQHDADIMISAPLDSQVTLTLRIVAYGDGQRLVLARDISHIEHMERARRDFVANASHELRTPLTVIRGYLEMMEDESSEARPLFPWRSPVVEMRQQATRMGRIIEDLLKLARIESQGGQGKQELINTAQMLELILDEARALSKGRHKIELDIQGSTQLVGHVVEIQSVFSNLIFNAVQYTPEDGEITVRWHADQEGALFSVTDTGMGIEPQHIPRLTERFYRADAGRSRATGGTGLGLAIVKHALEHHDSHLEIASELNVGSTFSCRFPARLIRHEAA